MRHSELLFITVALEHIFSRRTTEVDKTGQNIEWGTDCSLNWAPVMAGFYLGDY